MTEVKQHFERQYQTHLKHLKLKGHRPKTIDAYARAVRRAGEYFGYRIDERGPAEWLDYFSALVGTHSWSTVKLDLYGLRFYYEHVLGRPWVAPGLIKPPRSQRLPDIVTPDEARRVFAATRVVSYRVFFFTLYSLGLRLGEGLRLEVGDIDAARRRVHVRNAKGNKDRLVPLPAATLQVLRAYWRLHRHPRLLFPNRSAGRCGAATVTTALDPGGVQNTLRQAVASCGLKKRSHRTACATATPRT